MGSAQSCRHKDGPQAVAAMTISRKVRRKERGEREEKKKEWKTEEVCGGIVSTPEALCGYIDTPYYITTSKSIQAVAQMGDLGQSLDKRGQLAAYKVKYVEIGEIPKYGLEADHWKGNWSCAGKYGKYHPPRICLVHRIWSD